MLHYWGNLRPPSKSIVYLGVAPYRTTKMATENSTTENVNCPFSSTNLLLTRYYQPSANFSETLTRLSSKSGVKAALVIERSLSSVLMATGSFSFLRTKSVSTHTSTSTTVPSSLPVAEDGNQKDEGAQELATMVWNYVNSTEALVHGLDAEV